MSADEDQDSGVALNNSASELNVGTRVRVYPGSDNEKTGEIVDDFGQDAGTSVTIGNAHIAAASRRWAVALDGGGLVFVDSGDLSPQLQETIRPVARRRDASAAGARPPRGGR